MKQSNFYIPTQKDIPSNAVVKSHQLLLKAGYIYQHSAGIYSYLPMATKVLENIEKIISEEIENIGANKVILPMLEPKDLWEKSGRWQNYGSELFRVNDRHNNEFALSPTHEEVMTDLIKNQLNSYKKYPFNAYQINTKMRDEMRPRFGLIRAREFIMMDGYSFHTNNDSLMETYNDYYLSYSKIFDRLSIKYRIVSADNGQMGGSSSHEFMAIADCGEDVICYEESSGIAYNVEAAPIHNEYQMETTNMLIEEKIHTPKLKTIEDLSKNLNVDGNKFIKAVAYQADEGIVVCYVCGDREVETTKVMNCIKTTTLELATDEELKKHNLIPGFIGINLPDDIITLYDQELKYKRNLIAGGNEFDFHIKNINLDEKLNFMDIRQAVVGDLIRKDGEPISQDKGIEIGHIFALGDKYTKSLKMSYLDINQKSQFPLMGSYGIGVSRILSSIVEQNSDEFGIVWPQAIAPFKIHLIVLDYQKNIDQKNYADQLYSDLIALGHSVLLDDRDERPGFKFKDSELIGIPLQLIIGKSFSNDILELKVRETLEKKEIDKNELLKTINELFKNIK